MWTSTQDHRIIRVGEAVYEGHNSTPKTQGGIRDVPMGPALEQALRQHGVRSQTSDDSLVFPSRNGTHLRPGSVRKRHLLPACAKAELPRFGWHDFRRTHATLLSDMGEPLKQCKLNLAIRASALRQKSTRRQFLRLKEPRSRGLNRRWAS